MFWCSKVIGQVNSLSNDHKCTHRPTLAACDTICVEDRFCGLGMECCAHGGCLGWL